MQTTMKALQDAMIYLESRHRTEETLELRRLLRDAWAEQVAIIDGCSSKPLLRISMKRNS